MRISAIRRIDGVRFDEDLNAVIDADNNVWNVGDQLYPIIMFERYGVGEAFNDALEYYAKRKDLTVNQVRKQFIDLARELAEENLIFIESGDVYRHW